MELLSKDSGYDLGKGDWIYFLNCWENASEKLSDPDEGYLVHLSGEKRISKSIEFPQAKDVILPSSLVDFHNAYSELGGIYRGRKYEDGIGIFAPENVQPLSTYMEELLKIKNEWPDESNDADYFKYGIDQDNSSVRTSYQNNAIVIGQYGYDDYELIVMYPDSLTKDGEMETAIFAHASEARTPSFAEMMRQLSFYFTQAPDSIPIFSQEQLSGTCADKLLLKDIWWK